MLARGLLKGRPPARWWPHDSALEVALSAILTQRTKWENAAAAIENLRRAHLLDARALARAGRSTLERCLRPAGFYRQKARALREFGQVVTDRFDGSIDNLFELDDDALRAELLGWRGVGPETADAIMLYAAHRPAFAVDAYTMRLQKRFGAVSARAAPTYAQTADAWVRSTGADVGRMQALHGAIVDHCKAVCKAEPDCAHCELRRSCARHI